MAGQRLAIPLRGSEELLNLVEEVERVRMSSPHLGVTITIVLVQDGLGSVHNGASNGKDQGVESALTVLVQT